MLTIFFPRNRGIAHVKQYIQSRNIYSDTPIEIGYENGAFYVAYTSPTSMAPPRRILNFVGLACALALADMQATYEKPHHHNI